MEQIEIEKDKSIEELERRKSDLEAHFVLCSTKLTDRISRINADMPEGAPYFFVSGFSREQVTVLRREMQKLENYVNDIAVGSGEIWTPITSIERVKTRIESALEKAKALAELRTQTELLFQAYEKAEYEAAAEIVERQKNVQEICVIDNEETKEFEKHRKAFVNSIMKEYEQALKEKSLSKVKRLAKVLVKVEQREYAGGKYLENMKDEVKEKCDAVLKEIALIKNKDISSAEPVYISPYIGNIFSNLLEVISIHFLTIKEIFDKQAALECMKIIEKATDHYGENIIGIHTERVNDTKVTTVIENRELLRQKNFDIYNLFVKVDFVCEENASFSSQFQAFKVAYFDHVKAHFGEFVDPRFLRNSDAFEGISRRIYELISQYLILESFFLTESISRPISTEAEREQQLAKVVYKKAETLRGGDITQSVDDIAFVVEKCCVRGVGCREISTACAMLNNFQNIMLNVYYSGFARILEKQLEDPEKAVTLAQMFGSGEGIRLIPGFIIGLNNVATTIQNLKILKENVNKKLHQTYTDRTLVLIYKTIERDIQMGIAALNNIEELITKFRSLLTSCCEKAFGLFARDLAGIVKDLGSLDLVITNKRLQEYETHDPFLPSLLSQLKQCLRQWKQQLVDVCFEQFLRELIKKLSELLAGEIKKKKLTQAGGQYVEKLTIHLVNFFQNISAIPVRKQFIQLVHMSSMLSADSVEEVKDYIETAKATQEFGFTFTQVKEILGLRSDIPAESINKLTESA